MAQKRKQKILKLIGFVWNWLTLARPIEFCWFERQNAHKIITEHQRCTAFTGTIFRFKWFILCTMFCIKSDSAKLIETVIFTRKKMQSIHIVKNIWIFQPFILLSIFNSIFKISINTKFSMHFSWANYCHVCVWKCVYEHHRNGGSWKLSNICSVHLHFVRFCY